MTITRKIRPSKRAEKKASPEKTAAAKKAAARPRPARETSALIELTPIAQEINARVEKAAKLEGKIDDHRLSIAIKAHKAKKLCGEHGLNFREWAESYLTQGWDEIKRLVLIGGSDDPRQALEDRRVQTNLASKKVKEANRRAKAVQAQDGLRQSAPTPAAPPPQPRSKFKVVDDAMEALDDKDCLALVDRHAHRRGMVTMSETGAKSLRSTAQRVDELEARDTSLEYLKDCFSHLGPHREDEVPRLGGGKHRRGS